MMDFKEIVSTRYACKKFDGKTLPEEKVDALLEMIRLAPSAYNFQPWKIKIITDVQTRKKLQEASRGQVQVTSCSHFLVFCAETDFKTHLAELVEMLKQNHAPKEKIDFYTQRIQKIDSEMTLPEKLAWAQRQCYLALGNALNGAKSLGFDSCPMEGFDRKKYSEILSLPDNLVPTAACPIGYAADSKPVKQRLSNDKIFF